jgi:hypothetical protein
MNQTSRHMSKRNGQVVVDDAHITISEDYEVHYWTARLNCTSRQLRKAVQAVGSKAADVLAYLREHADE